MAEDHTIAKALAEISQRRDALQADYERIGAELAKLQMAEGALRAIVDNAPLESLASAMDGIVRANTERASPPAQPSGRGPRGPRANSAKGRLRTLLEETGPQGLSSAQIAQRLPDVAPATLNAYLSTMVSGGEAVRRGDFISLAKPASSDAEAPPARDDEAADEDEPASGDASQDE